MLENFPEFREFLWNLEFTQLSNFGIPDSGEFNSRNSRDSGSPYDRRKSDQWISSQTFIHHLFKIYAFFGVIFRMVCEFLNTRPLAESFGFNILVPIFTATSTSVVVVSPPTWHTNGCRIGVQSLNLKAVY
jgi:hypothetical protein